MSVAILCSFRLQGGASAPELVSQLLEVSGTVEVAPAGAGSWRAARPNEILRAGDRVRTGPDSRATLRLSDKSAIRVNQNTVLELTPPLRPAAKSRFRLRWGALFFLNREKPSDVEFETPLATGAIRGTEFLLTADASDGATILTLVDGIVQLQSANETISLTGGQQATFQPGQPSAVRAVLPAESLVQWALYYPGVLDSAELSLSDAELAAFAHSLQNYREGDLLRALAELPPEAPNSSESARAFRAALKLAVGRVDDARALLEQLPSGFAAGRALREVIQAVHGGAVSVTISNSPATGSEWLARSYLLQSASRLPEALDAVQRSIKAVPQFGFAWARLAELELSLGDRHASKEALARARRLCPRNAEALALEGFLALEARQPRAALDWFNQAISSDAALGHAWFGRGLANEQLRNIEEAQRDFQAAAILEPQRSVFRSYLAKAFSQMHEDALAQKDFRMAKQLDPHDPTPWLYSALHDQQLNRQNEGVRELERSIELNDNLSVFRSRQLLDRDWSIRSADLAALYDDTGLNEVSRLAASRSISTDYANFAGHLFLARSLQDLEDPNSFDLRLETARQSELLVANLLAPLGGGNLSQLLSQQDHLQYFDPRPFGASSLTRYGSGGDWQEAAALFGTVQGLSYALDSQYLSRNGQRPNNDLQQTRFIVSARQEVSPEDSLYAQLGLFESESGDVAQRYDTSTADRGLRVKEKQEPSLYGGYHHEWSPGNESLILVAHLRDELTLRDPLPAVLFLRQRAGSIIDVGTYPFKNLAFQSDFNLTSVEFQQIREASLYSIILGARYQRGSIEARSLLEPLLPSPNIVESVTPELQRADGYAYFQIRPLSRLRLTAGLDYDELSVPVNADLAPLTDGQDHRSLLSPKAAIEVDPWRGAHLRFAYTRSLGGLYFDNSVRLEPTQLANFTTAFRSLIPESVEGIVPGTRFETLGAGLDQSLGAQTFFGIEGQILKSDGKRGVGAVENSGFIPVPDSPAVTRQSLDFRERTLKTYINRLLGNCWAISSSYTLSEAELAAGLPNIPSSAPGLLHFDQAQRAVLGQLRLSAIFNHPTGFFAEWHSELFHQLNFGYTPTLAGDCFWQHDVFAGYRLPHRYAEIRVGVLNLADQNYRLNPLNLMSELPRARTFVTSVKLNF